jgi:hypothetical protein
MNLLADATAQLADDMDAFASTLCTYSRGSTTGSVPMTPCFNANFSLLREDTEVDEQDYEFIATVAKLPVSSPEVGDEIVLNSKTFVVVSRNGRFTFRPCDAFGTRMRIFTRAK